MNTVEHLRSKLVESRARYAERAEIARPSLDRLIKVCANKTGQSYKVRDLLYSLWNGRQTSLLNIISLDMEIRDDLLLVIAAFGGPEFFYDQITDGFRKAGLYTWFVEGK